MIDADADDALPGAAGELVRAALAEYPNDPARGDFLLNYASTQAGDPLPIYRVLYKFYNRQRRFEQARDFARRALVEAARQGALPAEPESWTRQHLAGVDPALVSHGLLALKALAFIALRRGDEAAAAAHLDTLRRLDPEDGSGVSVVTALAKSVREAG